MERITTKEVMEKLDMFQAIFVELYEFGWLDLERIQTDARMQFTSKEFQYGLYVFGVHFALVAPDHQKINGKF